jgi:MraZ protein
VYLPEGNPAGQGSKQVLNEARTMFRGSCPTRVDEKGRLKVPADYKRLLEDSGKRFYITSSDGRQAQVYPLRIWEEKEAAMGKLASTDPARQKFLSRTSYYGQEVEADQQGRLLLPQVLREAAKLTGDVLVLGSREILEIVNLDEFKKRMEEDPITTEEQARLSAAGI